MTNVAGVSHYAWTVVGYQGNDAKTIRVTSEKNLKDACLVFFNAQTKERILKLVGQGMQILLLYHPASHDLERYGIKEIKVTDSLINVKVCSFNLPVTTTAKPVMRGIILVLSVPENDDRNIVVTNVEIDPKKEIEYAGTKIRKRLREDEITLAEDLCKRLCGQNY